MKVKASDIAYVLSGIDQLLELNAKAFESTDTSPFAEIDTRAMLYRMRNTISPILASFQPIDLEPEE
jgi:hypothetical protein